jgi:hypothetical protein
VRRKIGIVGSHFQQLPSGYQLFVYSHAVDNSAPEAAGASGAWLGEAAAISSRLAQGLPPQQ